MRKVYIRYIDELLFTAQKIVKIVNRGEGQMRDGKTNRQIAAVTQMSISLIVANNERRLICFITRFLQRTDTKNEIITNYFDYDNERLTNTGLENLEKAM